MCQTVKRLTNTQISPFLAQHQLNKKLSLLLGSMSIAIITAFINRIIALKKPIKESKKKLKYKKTLYALKLSKASIFEFRFRNIN